MTALRLTAVLLCVLYLSEVASSMSSTRCCTQLGEHISKTFLKKVKRYEIQKQDGTCHLQAVLLHLQHKILCVNPENKLLQQWIQSQEQKSSGNNQEPRKTHSRRRNPKNKKKHQKEK